MTLLPTELNALYFVLTLVVAVSATLFAIIVLKTKNLDQIKEEFNQKELQLNRKLYETAVLKNKLEAMVERMTEGVFMLDKDFKLIVVNPACRRLLGISDTKRLTIFDIVRGFNQHFPIEETIAHVFETGDANKVSQVKVNDKFLQITVLPVEVAEGVPGVGVLLHDQTEEQNLRKEHEEFMAMIVHELRSPLTVIKGMADVMYKNIEKLTKEKQVEMLKQLETSTDSLLQMVNDLLTETKEDSTKFEIHKEIASLNDVLNKEIKNYEGLARERNLVIKGELDDNLRPFSFDPNKLTQVMNNLISNAIKFTKEGSITVKSIVSPHNLVQVEVIDTGEGVPANLKPQLFQKFVQLKNGKDSNMPGTGLGLVIAKGIVEAHGGNMWIEDNKPQGAKLIFTLPISD